MVDVASPSLNVLSLCSGIGALDLGVRLAYPESRVLCYVEGEVPCVETLVERFEDGALHEAPVWSDLTTFDSRGLEGRVDLVVSGIPCQPYSVAGDHRGNNDDRALWPHIVRIARECGPGAFFIENVGPFLHHAEPVWRELRELGYEWASPLQITASRLGAPHGRRRLFVLCAHPDRSRLAQRGDDSEALGQRRETTQRVRGDAPYWAYSRQELSFRGQGRGPWSDESPPCRVDDGPPNRVDAIRALGNAVVPVVAGYALRTLVKELGR